MAGTLLSALLNLAESSMPRRLFALGCSRRRARQRRDRSRRRTPAPSSRCGSPPASSLACVYPPGLKIAAGWFLERRGTALGIVVGALTIGSAFPHLLAWAAAGVPWRTLMVCSSALALVGGAHRRGRPSATVRTSARRRRSIRTRSARCSATAACGSRRSATSGTCGSSTRCGRGSRRSRPHRLAARGGRDPGRQGSLVAFVAIAQRRGRLCDRRHRGPIAGARRAWRVARCW